MADGILVSLGDVHGVGLTTVRWNPGTLPEGVYDLVRREGVAPEDVELPEGVWADTLQAPEETRLGAGQLDTSEPNTETSGGTRFSAGKPKLVGVPVLGLYEVARVSEYGAQKYALFDWHLGQSFSTCLNACARHLFRALLDPLARDPESGLLHLGHAAWNLIALLHFIEEGRAGELDDVTPWRGVSTAEKKAREEVPRVQVTRRRGGSDG